LNNSSIDYILPDEIEALKAEKFRPKLNKQNNKNIESSITSANSGPNNNSMEVMDKESLNQLQDLVSNPDNKQIRDSGELWKEVFEQIINSIKNFISDILDGSNKIIESYNNFIESITNSLNDFNHEQIGAIVHLSGSILIIHCLMSIILVLFGDKIIKYFGIEERYPKLALLFKLRRQILNINLIINFIIIILVLIVIIYLNFLILFS